MPIQSVQMSVSGQDSEESVREASMLTILLQVMNELIILLLISLHIMAVVKGIRD